MRLTPRYDGPPVLRFNGPAGDPSAPLLRQRRRLGSVLGGLGDDQWAVPSRCEGWTVRDVIAHLVGADQFWALSAAGALAGEPTRYLVGFDPVATPAQMVEATQAASPASVLADYDAAVEGLAGVLGALDDAQWELPAEAPPGHVSLRAMAHHALWDGWVHERDVVVPLGLAPVEEPDEVVGSLAYVAALSPTFAVSYGGSSRTGALVVDGTDPDVRVVVEAGDAVAVSMGGDAPAGALRLAGRAVDLVEGLSLRAPLDAAVPEEDRWLLDGLATVFDVPQEA